jgi:uncharacterized protein
MPLIPKDRLFFELLESQAAIVLKGSRKLLELLESFGTLDATYLAGKEVHEIEHAGDEIIHRIVDRLNKSFITPLDREDIHALTVRLDDILDYVDAVAKRLVTFKIQRMTPQAIELARILVRQGEEVSEGVHMLRDLRGGAIMRQCARIGQLEKEADQVLRDALTDLFDAHSHDPLEVIKWKDIYEHLEVATDKCEDVANILEAVYVKYS